MDINNLVGKVLISAKVVNLTTLALEDADNNIYHITSGSYCCDAIGTDDIYNPLDWLLSKPITRAKVKNDADCIENINLHGVSWIYLQLEAGKEISIVSWRGRSEDICNCQLVMEKL